MYKRSIRFGALVNKLFFRTICLLALLVSACSPSANQPPDTPIAQVPTTVQERASIEQYEEPLAISDLFTLKIQRYNIQPYDLNEELQNLNDQPGSSYFDGIKYDPNGQGLSLDPSTQPIDIFNAIEPGNFINLEAYLHDAYGCPTPDGTYRINILNHTEKGLLLEIIPPIELSQDEFGSISVPITQESLTTQQALEGFILATIENTSLGTWIKSNCTPKQPGSVFSELEPLASHNEITIENLFLRDYQDPSGVHSKHGEGSYIETEQDWQNFTETIAKNKQWLQSNAVGNLTFASSEEAVLSDVAKNAGFMAHLIPESERSMSSEGNGLIPELEILQGSDFAGPISATVTTTKNEICTRFNIIIGFTPNSLNAQTSEPATTMNIVNLPGSDDVHFDIGQHIAAGTPLAHVLSEIIGLISELPAECGTQTLQISQPRTLQPGQPLPSHPAAVLAN